MQRLVPSINSITHQRKGTIEGSDRIRQDISNIFWQALHRRGQATCHLACDGPHVLISEETIPPVEVVVKAALIGTPSRIYHGLFERIDRFGRRFEPHQPHPPYVRFDYRNPLRTATGEGLRDECLPRGLAHRLIDTNRAERSTLTVFEVVRHLLRRCELDLLDACFLYDVTGEVLCYEISPDNMRVKGSGWAEAPAATAEYDKDLWRDGAEHSVLIEQWRTLHRRLQQAHG